VIDFHCHLDLYPNPAAIVEDCKRRGLYVLSVTTTPSAWRGTSALASNAHRIQTALGLHPQLAHERSDELPLFDELLPQVRYVGEIGLDGTSEYHRHWHTQITVFEHILAKCSAAGGRIMTIHSRRASSAVLDRIQKFPDAGTFVLHWFSGSARDLDRAMEIGCWFSVGPTMLKGERGRALAARMPRERVLIESDGPFAQLDGTSALPWQAPLALDELSRLWFLPHSTVEHMLVENLHQLVKSHDSPP
jgi:TatD DNase family protein